jgi:DNA-directed RNA polymerase specialized sigma24 family protein
MRNIVIDDFRHSRRKGRPPSSQRLIIEPDRVLISADGPTHAISFEEFRKLHPTSARILELQAQGYTYEDIMAKLGCSRAEVGRDINHAKQMIKDFYKLEKS